MLPAGQYLFLLPFPLGEPGPEARLGGMACVRTDETFTSVGKMEFLPCRFPEHALPSPSYLFAQGLNPFRLADAPSESDFFAQVVERLSVPNTRVITWSARHLQALNAVALRLLRNPVLPSGVISLTALNQVLKTSWVFGTLNKKPGKDLLSCARMLGFTETLPRFAPEGRLKALLFIAALMAKGDEAVFAFQLRTRAQLRKAWDQACGGQKLLATLNADCVPELLKPVEPGKEGIFKALRFDGDEVSGWYYLQEDCELLAPAGILTPERQERLHFDFKAAAEALENFEGKAEDKRPLPYWQTFFAKLSPSDREFFAATGDKALQFQVDPGSKYSDFLRSWILWYRGDNFRGSLSDAELQLYTRRSRAEVIGRLDAYLQEAAALQNYVNENNPEDLKLVEAIQRYVLDL